MDINKYYKYFMTIINEKSITNAAKKLYISQSSLSQYLSKLETEVGAKLIDRSSSPITLTKEGEIYKNYIEKEFFLYNKFKAEMYEYSKMKTYTISLGIGSWRGSSLLPEIIPDFIKNIKEDINFKLFEYPVSELLGRLSNGEFNFCIMNTSSDYIAKEFIRKVIRYEKILILYNKKKFPQLKDNISNEDLRNLLNNEYLISLDKNLTVGSAVNNFIENNNIVVKKLVSTTNNETAVKLVREGLGFCFLVETGVPTIGIDDLGLIDLDSNDLLLPLSIIYKKDSYLSEIEKSFIAELEKYYKNINVRYDKKIKYVNVIKSGGQDETSKFYKEQ